MESIFDFPSPGETSERALSSSWLLVAKAIEFYYIITKELKKRDKINVIIYQVRTTPLILME